MHPDGFPSPATGSTYSAEKSHFDVEHKIIIIGDSNAGKSSFFHQFLHAKFKKQATQTIGVEFGAKVITLQNDKRRVKINVWDTAGQERYRAVTRAYYRDAKGAVILFDVTSRESFQHLPDWFQDAQSQAAEGIQIMVVGNKSDLVDKREVPFEDANAWATKQGVMFLETSALTGENVQDAFQILTQLIQAQSDKEREATEEVATRGMPLKPAAAAPKKSCCGT